MNGKSKGESDDTDARRSLFLVLEGGGAKGIAHVAAWSVLQPAVVGPLRASQSNDENEPGKRGKFVLEGVAGTSAGAIMAAFIAAGAQPNDLINEQGNLPLAREIGITRFTDLFGVKGWRWLRFLRLVLAPSRGFSQIASQLKPKRFRPPPKEPGNDRPYHVDEEEWNYVGSSMLFNPVIWFLTFMAILPVLYVALDKWMFDNPTVAAVDLLAFWIVQQLCFAFSSSRLRKHEELAVRTKRRPVPFWVRFRFHSGITFLAALAITVALAWLPVDSWLLSYFVDLNDPTPRWVTFVLFAVLGLLVGGSLVGWLRRFFKGTVDTAGLRRDLNTALIAILTKDSYWDPQWKRYEWRTKKPSSVHEQALIKRFAENPDSDVTFDDLYKTTGVHLTIVTADVVTNQIYTYSTSTHRTFSVARAVSGSLAIPFAFRPMSDAERILVDGGVVSSIPAWLFRRHRTLDPDARILAVGIAAADYETWIPYFLAARKWKIRRWDRWGLGWLAKACILTGQMTASTIWPLRFLANIVSTTAYGARALELDASDRLDVFELRPRVHLLDFDLGPERLKAEVDHLKKEANFFITNVLWGRKEAFAEVCGTIAIYFWRRAWLSGSAHDDVDNSARIRMFWAERDGPVPAVRIKATYGFDDTDLDDRLVLAFGSSMTGWAADTERSQFGTKPVLEKLLRSWRNRYREAVKWKELQWCWAIPVHHPKTDELVGVFAIESNRPMSFFDRLLSEQANERAQCWMDPLDGDRLRPASNALAEGNNARDSAEAMTSLEAIWADYVWDNYAGSDLFAETAPPDPPVATTEAASRPV